MITMSSIPLDYSKIILALITGTTRGIGKAATLSLGKRLVSGSKIVAVSNVASIQEKIALLNEMKSRNLEVYFNLHLKDLSNIDLGEYMSIVDKSIIHPSVRDRHYEYGLVIHNAGTLGVIDESTKLQSVQAWKSYYDLNFFSPTLLNAIFITKCRPYVKHIFVVNVTSIYSVRPQPKLGMYCSAKAARNAYFSVLAKEEPDVSVMNYSPGPVATTLLDSLKQSHSSNQPDVETISTEDAVYKMFDILSKGNYKSGGFIDYYGRTS